MLSDPILFSLCNISALSIWKQIQTTDVKYKLLQKNLFSSAFREIKSSLLRCSSLSLHCQNALGFFPKTYTVLLCYICTPSHYCYTALHFSLLLLLVAKNTAQFLCTFTYLWLMFGSTCSFMGILTCCSVLLFSVLPIVYYITSCGTIESFVSCILPLSF